MKNKTIKNDIILLAGLLCLFILSLISIFYFKNVAAEPTGHDIWGHLYKSRYLYNSLKQGTIYPLYDSKWYNGVQIYRYWAPFSYYLMSLIMCFTGGNVVNAYFIFIGIYIFFAGLPFLAMGKKLERPVMGISLALLWFFMPENVRVFMNEGNLPRMVTAFIFPYLVYFIWRYLREKRTGYLFGILFFTLLITLTHVMIAAMVGIGTFLFLLFDFRKSKGIKTYILILITMIGGIALAGIWLVPAMSGGMVSMKPEAASYVMTTMMYDLTTSLNPLNRWGDNPGIFYYGLGVALVSLFGVVLAKKNRKAGFFLALLVLLLTTPDVLPFLTQLPMSQMFWMMRFAFIAYGFFFLTLMEWKELKKIFVIIVVGVLVLDALPSLGYERYFAMKTEGAAESSQILSDMTDKRASLMDLSGYGSYVSYGLCQGYNGKNYTFGWAWQGAATSDNIVQVNQALEDEKYDYLFDRSVELGDDAVCIVKAFVGSHGKSIDDVIESAQKSGYSLKYETDNAYYFKLDCPEDFAVITEYAGIVIGEYGAPITLAYPSLKQGEYDNIQEYTYDELRSYGKIILSGASYDDREAAEDLIKRLADEGVEIIIDMAHMPTDNLSRQQVFLNAIGMNIAFSGNYPVLSYKARSIIADSFPEEYETWNTVYIAGEINETGTFSYEGEELCFAGSDSEYENITYVGLNLMYYYSVVENSEIGEMLNDIIGVSDQQIPVRTLVPMTVNVESDKITININETDVDEYDSNYNGYLNTTLAFQDIFNSDQSLLDDNNLLYVEAGTTEIYFKYPLLIPGIGVSVLGMIIFLVAVLWSKKNEKNDKKDILI
jgi:uncharacterized membrane protein